MRTWGSLCTDREPIGGGRRRENEFESRKLFRCSKLNCFASEWISLLTYDTRKSACHLHSVKLFRDPNKGHRLLMKVVWFVSLANQFHIYMTKHLLIYIKKTFRAKQFPFPSIREKKRESNSACPGECPR